MGRIIPSFLKGNNRISTDSIKLAKIDFDEYLNSRLSEAAENNNTNNLKRGNFLHDATLYVAIALAFLVLAAPLYIYQKIASEAIVHQVEIVKPLTLKEKFNMSNETGNSGNSTSQQATPASAPVAAPASAKPSGPPNVVFKGSVDLGNVNTRAQSINKVESKE